MGERLTWDELQRAYPDQWIMVVDIEWVDPDVESELLAAVTVGHGPTAKAALANASSILERYPGFGCYFTGVVR